MRNFTTCHCHPASLDSGSTVEALALREVELGTGTLTQTDHGTLAGSRALYDTARKHKLTPILGLEAYFRDDDCPILAEAGIVKQVESAQPDAKLTTAHYLKYFHVTLHAKDQAAFETLVKVLSKADLTNAEQHGSERKPLFTWQDMEVLGGQNMTVGSGCLIGMVQRHLLENKPELAKKYYERLRGTFKPGNFYVEAFPHVCDSNYIKAVFLKVEGEKDERRFHLKKWVRIAIKTKKAETVEDIQVQDLSKLFTKWLGGKADVPTVRLVAVKNYSAWTEEEPKQLLGARLVDGEVKNECTDFAPDGDVQLGANEFVIRMAEKYGDPILVSDDSHFAHPADKVVQDIRLSGLGNWKFVGVYNRQSSEDAFGYFNRKLDIDQAQFEGWVENSKVWASQFGWEFKDRKSLPTKFYPTDTLAHTLKLIKETGRFDASSKVQRERLKAEIDMLHSNGSVDLLPYFFVDQEVVSLYEKNGRLTGPGRGSAAGLLLSYCLGITHVDPLKYGLSKERFLTKERILNGKWPDIDQDLPDRDLLFDPETGWLKKRFGDHWAPISTDTQLRLKSSILDVHRSQFGEVSEMVAKLTQRMEVPPQGIEDTDFVFGYEDSTGHDVRGSIETDPALMEYVRTFPKQWEVVQKCLGIARQKSRHACGNVICNEPVSNFIPLTKVGDIIVTAYTAPAVEAAGGLKMDFLGVNSLKDIEACIALVQERLCMKRGDRVLDGKRVPGLRLVPDPDSGDAEDKVFDIWDLPEDRRVFFDLCSGKSKTVFQFGTDGAMGWMTDFFFRDGKPAINTIEALAAFTALDRPGPLDYFSEAKDGSKRNMLMEFAARAYGDEPIDPSPILGKLFPETYGIIVYQEQLQKAYQVLGKTSGEKADEFRVHIGKKQMKKVMADKADFMPGATEQLGLAEAQRMWDMMETFGQYGFNKSHAVAYTVIGYACAWLKHHYPLEWWTGVLRNAERGEVDKKLWKHISHLMLPPDVKMSGDNFDIEGDKIRAPLRMLVGIGPKAHEELVAGRPYKDLEDFVLRTRQNREKTAVEVVDKKTGKLKLKLGRTSIGPALIRRLLISGSADGLFADPVGMSVYDKLAQFGEVYAKTFGKKKAQAIPSIFQSLSSPQQYLLRKSVLPSYVANLVPLFSGRKDIKKYPVKGRDDLFSYAWEMPRKFEGNPWCHLLPGPAMQATLDGKFKNLPPKWKMGCVAYVSEAEAFWGGKALKVRFEADGERFEIPLWPPRTKDADGNPVKGVAKLPEGAVKGICIVTISRWDYDKNFAIDDIKVLEPAFNVNEEESAE
jgi:DNA-directed DNA polymerase III PolC